MKFKEFKKYFTIFILAVSIIAVYKTFDNISAIFSAVGSFISMLSPILAAFVISFLLFPMCKKTETFINNKKFPAFMKKRSRAISVVSVYVLVISLLTAIAFVLVPPIIKSLGEFIVFVTENIDDFIKELDKSKYIKIDIEKINKYIDFKKFFENSGWFDVDVYTSKIMDVSSSIVNGILCVITSVYILIDRESLGNFAKKVINIFVSRKKRDFLMIYIRRGAEFAYRYLFCILMDALIVFVLSFVVMTILNVEHASVLALMLGIFNIVPYFGAIVAGVIAVLVTMATSEGSAWIILAIALTVLQQVDANIIQPHLVKGKLDVKPFWVLVGILVGGYLFGIIGILIIVPVLALCRTIINDYFAYREAQNDDNDTQTDEIDLNLKNGDGK